jgi:hypothetical protein
MCVQLRYIAALACTARSSEAVALCAHLSRAHRSSCTLLCPCECSDARAACAGAVEQAAQAVAAV